MPQLSPSSGLTIFFFSLMSLIYLMMSFNNKSLWKSLTFLKQMNKKVPLHQSGQMKYY